MPGPPRPQDHNERDEDNSAQRATGREMLALSPEMTWRQLLGGVCVCVID